MARTMMMCGPEKRSPSMIFTILCFVDTAAARF
jgi:hypothetical protein